jgi:hypothetical protein
MDGRPLRILRIAPPVNLFIPLRVDYLHAAGIETAIGHLSADVLPLGTRSVA